MNKKNIAIIAVIGVAVLGVALYFVLGRGAATNTTNNPIGIVVPTSPPDINGEIISIIGNELTIKRYLVSETLTDAEKAAKQAERQKLSAEERQALKAAENAEIPSEIIKVTIPVGTKIVKNSGEALGSSSGANLLLSSLDEAKAGFGIQIWKENGEILIVKLKVV